MRRPWIVGVLLAGLLLGACGDPASGPEQPPPDPALPTAAPSPTTTTRQRPAASPTAPTAPTAADAAAKAPTVLYLGDSLAMESQKVLGQSLREQVNARYTSAPYSGTTLCDYLEGTGERSLVPPTDKAAALVRSLRPDFVVLQFLGELLGLHALHGRHHVRQGTSHVLQAVRGGHEAADGTDRGRGRRATTPDRLGVAGSGPDHPGADPDRERALRGRGRGLPRPGRRRREDGEPGDGPLHVGAVPAVHRVRARPCVVLHRTGPRPHRLHRDDDYLHFCLAPTTSTPKPCPVRSPGIARITREITRVIADHVG